MFNKFLALALTAFLGFGLVATSSAKEKAGKDAKKEKPAMEEMTLVGTLKAATPPAAEGEAAEASKKPAPVKYVLVDENAKEIALKYKPTKENPINLADFVDQKVTVVAQVMKKGEDFTVMNITSITKVEAAATEGTAPAPAE